ncbi:MAG: hypothetical protein KDK39_18790 [Leptospiraceae bacterium]|nr:hypothetical protein [Leptospiraceae bacterium]
MPVAFDDPDFLPGALSGFLMHTMMWFSRISVTSLSCPDDCQSLMLLDMPVSLFYFFMDGGLRIFFSLVLGGILWGIGGWLGLRAVRMGYDLWMKSRR